MRRDGEMLLVNGSMAIKTHNYVMIATKMAEEEKETSAAG